MRLAPLGKVVSAALSRISAYNCMTPRFTAQWLQESYLALRKPNTGRGRPEARCFMAWDERLRKHNSQVASPCNRDICRPYRYWLETSHAQRTRGSRPGAPSLRIYQLCSARNANLVLWLWNRGPSTSASQFCLFARLSRGFLCHAVRSLCTTRARVSLENSTWIPIDLSGRSCAVRVGTPPARNCTRWVAGRYCPGDAWTVSGPAGV